MTVTVPAIAPSAEKPRLFEHDLDADLFTPDRLDLLCRRAEQRGTLKVQFADPGRQRHGNEPIYASPRYPIVDDVLRRPLQYRIMDAAVMGPEYAACLERVFDLAGPDPGLGRIDVTTAVRVFSPHAVVALHGDPDLKLVCDVSGETIWHVRPPEAMTSLEHENLLRGRFFLDWRDWPDEPLHIRPAHGCFVPSRWAHWLTHPCEEPIVSFEIGFWTTDSVRTRKVSDVNWLLRRLGVQPKAPGAGADGAKIRLFDAISTATRRGLPYRGV